MAVMFVLGVNVQGDLGGTGISRFHVKRIDETMPSPADSSAAAAAVHAFYSAINQFIPASTQWVFPTSVQLVDEATSELQGYMNVPVVPATVTGTASGSYPAGNGARVDWLTATIRNRRLMRAATFVVPLGSNAYTGTGGVSSVVGASISGAATSLLGAMLTANLTLLAYHRPAKGTFTGGLSATVTANRVPLTPATLRSRRT